MSSDGRSFSRGELIRRRACRRNVSFSVACVVYAHAALGAELPPLVFLGDKDYPPVAYLEDGIAKGMDVDLAKAIAAQMKREIRIELMDWNLAQEKVLKGEADGLLGLSVSDERRKLYDFATPTFTREFGLVVRSGGMSIRGVGDLAGKRVAVTSGGFPRKFLDGRPGVNLVLITNYADGLSRLVAGTIDVLAADLWVAAYLIERKNIRGVAVVGKPFATAPGAIAMKKGNVALLDDVNRAIDTLKADGEIKKIQDDWRPQEMVFASRERLRGVVTRAVVALLVILFGAMTVWIVTLRKQIHIRKNAESALKQSEERFQLAVRGSTDGLWDRDILTDEVFFADRYRELLGYSPNEFPGTFASFESRLHPEDKERVLKMVGAHLKQRQPYDAEYRLRTKSGEYRWFRGRGQAVWDEQGRAIRMAGSITDITDRKQAEERINLLQTITMDVATAEDLAAALEVVLRRVCEKTGWVLGQAWIPNHEGTALDCCPAWFAPEGMLVEFRALSRTITFEPAAGLPGRVWSSREPLWIRDVTRDLNFPRSAAAEKSGLKAGLAVPILSGEKVIAVLEFFLRESRPEDERLVQVIAAVAAQIGLVIERKRAEEALRESEGQFRAVVEFSPECIAVAVDDRLAYVNPAGARMVGADDPAKLIGRSVYDFAPADMHEAMKERRRAVLAGGVASPPMTVPMLRLDGSAVFVEAVAVPFVYRGRQAILNLIRDITERKRAETERQQTVEREQQARMEYTRQLIASQEAERRRIAVELHDSLGQGLLLIKNRAQLALGPPPSDTAAQLEAISGLASQAVAEVRQISRDLHPYQVDHLGLTRALEAMIEGAAQSSEVVFEQKLDPADDVFSVDTATNLYRIVQESLNNILKHSRAKRARIELERDVHEVVLRIEDDGEGFDVNSVTGAGLGLRNMTERVHILGGTLKVDSQPSRGTRIEVTIRIREESKQRTG